MRTGFQNFLLVFFMIISGIFFMSPVLISALTGNWWYIFLFFVTWIPALGTIILAGIFIE